MVKLIDNEELINSGGYFILKTDGTIKYVEVKPAGMKFIDKSDVEDILFRSSLKILQEFSKTKNNKDVYVVVVDITTENLDLFVYINTILGLNKIYEHYGKDESLKYAPGDFEYMYIDEIPEEARWLSKIYSAIFYGWNLPELQEDIAVKNEFFDNEIIKIGLKVTEKLEKETYILNKIDDFIMFYCDHDTDYFYNEEYKKKYNETFDE
jgi:hypothetical protein